METLSIAILPGFPRFDVSRIDPTTVAQPTEGQGDELRSIVHAEGTGYTTFQYELLQNSTDLFGDKARLHFDGKAFPCELIAHTEDSQLLALEGFDLDEVKAPDRIGTICHQLSHGFARADALAYPTRGNRQSFPSPESVNPLMVKSFARLLPLTSNILMSQTIPSTPLSGISDKLLQPLHQLGLVLVISPWLVA